MNTQPQQLAGAMIEESFGWSNIHVVPGPEGITLMFDVGPPQAPVFRKKVTLPADAAKGIGEAMAKAAAELTGGIAVAGSMGDAERMMAQAKAAEAALRNGNGQG